jgi:hypothetical protein
MGTFGLFHSLCILMPWCVSPRTGATSLITDTNQGEGAASLITDTNRGEDSAQQPYKLCFLCWFRTLRTTGGNF